MSVSDVVLLVGLFLTVLNIINIILLFKDRAGKPHKQNETRIVALELEVSEIKRKLESDNDRIGELEAETIIIMRSVNALLGHSIDGNNEAELRGARQKMSDYLIEKR